ncbi:hypothetical protein HPB52_018548 [Rhipicephalus sanguineus]|uniref:UBC core domain-containing protein n=1 Tax=Rhipicephalus sanguineus TaxID=34632 RepID=A0A9D4SYY8_RHISA|nr:hypothetical protein HPB52_018548 [Rhipicephalus sanguineus]
MPRPSRYRHAWIWSPISRPHEEPTSTCLARAARDINELMHGPKIPGIHAHVDEGNMTQIEALLIGPPNTPFEGGFFHVALKLPPEYPAIPPRVRFLGLAPGHLTVTQFEQYSQRYSLS